MVVWRVNYTDAGMFNVRALVVTNDIWSSMQIFLKDLSDPPHETLSIKSTSSFNCNSMEVIEPEHSIVMAIVIIGMWILNPVL